MKKDNDPSTKKSLSRREFIGVTAASATALSMLPRHVLAGPKFVAPGDKVKIACIGNGTQGTRVMLELLKNPNLQIVAVCDPNLDDNTYLNWGKYEVRDEIRGALDEPDWDKGVEGCRCGRRPAQQIVETWYTKQTGQKYTCASYADFRDLLAMEKNVDAVVVGAVDHQHAQISIKAMQAGKHVLCQKPMTNAIYEARLMAKVAQETGVATQVLTYNSSDASTDMLCEMIWSGIIGPVREVHNWSNRPVWPSGFIRVPQEKPKPPKGFDWDLWLGRAPDRPYHPIYTHTIFRSWYDFGTGAIGDMGCYSFDAIYRALKLGAPTFIEASASTTYDVIEQVPTFFDNSVSHPRAMTAFFKFPERGPGFPELSFYWYDGGIKPIRPPEMEQDGMSLPEEGTLYIGDYGKIWTDFTGGEPRLLPLARNKTFTAPPPSIPRSKGHVEDWLEACKGGPKPRATFEWAAPVTESLCLAVIAMRTGKRLQWDAANMTFVDAPDANELIKPTYRKGWEL